ncbi:MAG: DUF4058 family protein [Candidatus Promineofilum sp.]|nr:DUF4058 family protein [Promineifilum sp.]
MSSPFPGMDPYLEGDMWQEFHGTLAHSIRQQLLAILPPRYVALLSKRYVLYSPSVSLLDLPDETRVIYPDVHVAETPSRVAEAAVVYGTHTNTPPSTQLPSFMAEEVPLLSIEVQDVASRRLVTAIEILSPVNKVGLGWAEYETKRRDLLMRPVHLLELDLLRRGRRITLDGKLPPADYYAYLSRFTHRPYTDVWAIGLRDRLPVLPVPLLPPDEDVLLDLQRAADACYDLVHYERLLDYTTAPPPPPLSEADALWLAEQLKAR